MTPIARQPAAPGPRGRPFVGVLPRMRRDPLGLFIAAAREYGDVVRLPVGPERVLLVNHPRHIQRVLQDNHRNYRLTRFYRHLRPVFGEGVFAAEGARWRHQRGVLQPAFQRERLEALAPAMTEGAAEMIARWRTRPRPEAPLDVAAEMSRLTLDIVARALFGMPLGARAPEAAEAVRVLLETSVARTTDLTPLGRWWPGARNRRFNEALRLMRGLVGDILRRRRAAGTPRADLLSLLLDDRAAGGTDETRLRDEVMTMLVSGNATTANALTWTWYLLARHPRAEAAVRAELAHALGSRMPGARDLAALSYTRMALGETLRLYPPTWRLARTAAAADEIGGCTVPAGTIVVFSPYLVHRHPAFWDSPEAFDPGRFAPGAASGRPPFAYIPFGGGPRACLGSRFALMEMQLVVATVMQAFRLRLPPGHTAEIEPVATLRPRPGLPMWLEPLSDTAAAAAEARS